jgi:hypothetical protein
VPVLALASHVPCPYCGHAQAIPPALLHELGQYQQRLAAHAERVRADERAAVAASRRAAEEGPFSAQGWIIMTALLVGPALVLQGVSAVCRYLELFPRDALRELEGWAGGLSPLFTFAGLGIYALLWQRRASIQLRAGPAAPLSSVVCPSCGAPNPFGPGEILRACRYCSAALAPSQTAMRRTLDHAEAEARRARMTRMRAERRSVAELSGLLDRPVIRLLLEGMLFIAGLAGGFLVPMFEDRPGRKPQPYDFEVDMAVIALVLIGTLVVVGWTLRRFDRMRRWHGVIAGLQARLGGRREHRAAPIVRWFDTYWAAHFPSDDIRCGGYGGAVEAALDGFPALALVDAPKWNDNHSPKVVLLAAAVFPGSRPPPLPADPLRSWIEQQGLAVQSTEGGLVARADEATRKRLEEHPEQIQRLAEVLGALVRLAQRMGGCAAEAMP